MNEDLPLFFKGHDIFVEEINKGEGEWVAYVQLRAGYEKELVPGEPFPTPEGAHKNAIRFLVEHR